LVELKINNEITSKQVLVIDENGKQLGFMRTYDAIKLAESKNLDLVCVAPKESTPVCKLLNYGKYKYEQTKHEKEMKKNQHNVGISEIQITYVIADHDLETKAKAIKRLIEDKNNDVRIVLRLRGREANYTDIAKERISKLIEMCSDYSRVKKAIFIEGRDIKAIIGKK